MSAAELQTPYPEDPGHPEQTAGTSAHADTGLLLETLNDGVIILDRGWRIAYANASARSISRIAPEQLNGPTHWELYPATVGTEQERVYRESMERRVSLPLEVYYAPFDLWISLETLPVPSGIAVHYRDVTRLKRAEAMRDDNARRLEQVFEATTDAIIQLDHDYTITFLNRRAQELLAPSGELLGRNLWASFPDADYEGSPFRRAYHRTMTEHVPSCFEAYYPAPLNLRLSVDVRPSEGGLIAFFRDITEEREAAEELQLKSKEAERQAAEIEALYRTAPIGLALFDAEEFRYLRLNDRQAAFFGMKPEEIVGRTLTEMAPIPGLYELFDGVRKGTPVVNYALEGELTSHPGEHRYWTVNYFPVYGADGTVQAISAASLEITAQRKAERALVQSEKLAAVGRLASSISHEINNPLEAITNLLYLVADSEDLVPGLREWVELAQSELARVSQITVQSLRFHRQTVRPTRVRAEELLRPLEALFRARLANAHVSEERRFRGGRRVLCFENEVRQVLSNLVSNALDAMRTGGRLLLRGHDGSDARTGREGVVIVVADTGTGMSGATLARLFEPFFTTKELNGTGLGMWIASEIVERHGGRLTVKSRQGEGRSGTVFRLFLPLEPAGLVPGA